VADINANSLIVYAPLISAIAGIFSVLTTIFAYKVSNQSARVARNSLEPHVYVALRSSRANKNLINLIIKNSGNGVARDITFKLKGDNFPIESNSFGAKTFQELNVFKSGIATLAKDEERKYSIVNLIGKFPKMLQVNTVVKVSYMGTIQHSEEYTIEFHSIEDIRWEEDRKP
jgi:hypothetical protein